MKNKGFTIIEAMICAAIVGIMAAIAIPQVRRLCAASQSPQALQEYREKEVFCKLMRIDSFDLERSKVMQKYFEDYKRGKFMPVRGATDANDR